MAQCAFSLQRVCMCVHLCAHMHRCVCARTRDEPSTGTTRGEEDSLTEGKSGKKQKVTNANDRKEEGETI